MLTEGWCGDAAQILPVLNKIDQAIDNIDVKLLYRDQNLELMDEFLTNGGRSIPKVIIVDKNSLEAKEAGVLAQNQHKICFLFIKTAKQKRNTRNSRLNCKNGTLKIKLNIFKMN